MLKTTDNLSEFRWDLQIKTDDPGDIWLTLNSYVNLVDAKQMVKKWNSGTCRIYDTWTSAPIN